MEIDPEEFQGVEPERELRMTTPKKPRHNRIRCKKCDTVIESKHRHDFVRCPCKAVAVDGGRDYLKRVGDPADYEELSL